MQIPSSCNYSLSNANECNHSFIHIHSCSFRSITLVFALPIYGRASNSRIRCPPSLSFTLTSSICFSNRASSLPFSFPALFPFDSLLAPLTPCAPVIRKCVWSLNGNIFAECQCCRTTIVPSCPALFCYVSPESIYRFAPSFSLPPFHSLLFARYLPCSSQSS